MTPRETLSQFQALDKYSQYRYEWQRRETWRESVHTAIAWLDNATDKRISRPLIGEIHKAVLSKQVLPSMRLLAMKGPAADRNHAHIYNCCFMAVDTLQAFSEAVTLAMAGVGVAFSVEAMHVSRLPVVNLASGKALRHTVEDSADGWARAVEVAVSSAYAGHEARFDLSLIRPAGAVLRTKGGRASGPGPLEELLYHTTRIIRNAAGRKLRPIEVYDIMCWIGYASVSGGVRHTAMLCLSDFYDHEMLEAKSANYWNDAELHEVTKRELANNSVAITARLTRDQWEDFLMNGPLGATGEPNVFNRRAALNTMPYDRCRHLSSYESKTLGLNVCGEVLLIPQQFCNLTTPVLSPGLSEPEIARRVYLASVLGMMQAQCTHFPGLRQEWHNNAEDETLLGVSPTGWAECKPSHSPNIMRAMKTAARVAAIEAAQMLGARRAEAITCVKPSGNSSLLADATAGIHADFYPYYIRRVTIQKTSPLLPVLEAAGVPIEQLKRNDKAVAAVFPIAARGIVKSELSAIDQLETHLTVKEHFCDHNVSQTVTFNTGEEGAIIDWMYEHQDVIVGVTFLRDDGNVYEQAPIEEIAEAEYNRLLAEFPDEVDWSLLDESDDYTNHVTGCDGERCML